MYTAGQGLTFFVYQILDPGLLCVDRLQFDEIAEPGDPLTRLANVGLGPEKVDETLEDFKRVMVSWKDKIASGHQSSETYSGGGEWSFACFRSKTVVVGPTGIAICMFLFLILYLGSSLPINTNAVTPVPLDCSSLCCMSLYLYSCCLDLCRIALCVSLDTASRFITNSCQWSRAWTGQYDNRV